MRILVTGVTGFVGRALALTLAARGDQVGGTYIEGRKPRLGIDLYPADLLDSAAMAVAVDSFSPDRIVHLAGLSHVGKSFNFADRYQVINVGGTENLIRAAGGTPIVLASSAEVYGAVAESEQPIAETREPAPQNPYGESKVAAERLVRDAGGVIVRCFNIIGPGQNESFALPSFARQLAQIRSEASEPILRVGNLGVRRDFLHVEDAAEGYVLLLERAERGSVYNLGSGRAHRIGDLLERLIAISGLGVTVEVDPDKFRPADTPLFVADVGRIRALGWAPRYDVDAALEEIWRAAVN